MEKPKHVPKVLAYEYLEHPLFWAHILNAIFIGIAILIVVFHFKLVRNMGTYQLLMLSLAFSISVGVHGLTHQALEKAYGYNPMKTLLHGNM
jgi:hypothetical protein